MDLDCDNLHWPVSAGLGVVAFAVAYVVGVAVWQAADVVLVSHSWHSWVNYWDRSPDWQHLSLTTCCSHRLHGDNCRRSALLRDDCAHVEIEIVVVPDVQ